MSFILGGPCSGKSFFGSRLGEASKGKIEAISTGDLIRAEIKTNEEFARRMTEIVRRGYLVPVEFSVTPR